VALALRLTGRLSIGFDTTLQAPLMVAFFTTVGLGASLSLLRPGGPQVALFWLLASLLAVAQNLTGLGVARVLGVNPLVGLVAGSITMTGGHGTGAAFGKLLEDQYGLAGALPLAMAAATFGLVSGGLLGGPVATWLLRRHHPAHLDRVTPVVPGLAHAALDEEIDTEMGGEAPTAYTLLQTMTIVLVAMALGAELSGWIGRWLTLPAYIGAMLVAAVIRNIADLAGGRAIRQRVVDDLGSIALALFLAMALMSLRLWDLVDLALPLVVILVVQVAVMGVFAYVITFRVMGRDYDAAVMAGGHCGFGLGATPNAVANMEAITERYGPAPRAFLVVPMVGAFFIDFTNGLIITGFINWVR
jgi:glutamate:Na+ symporter, ESS family